MTSDLIDRLKGNGQPFTFAEIIDQLTRRKAEVEELNKTFLRHMGTITRQQREILTLRASNERMREVVDAARRAIGDHNAPGDCYATGPMTGDPIRDLVECPACAFLSLHAALTAPAKETNDG